MDEWFFCLASYQWLMEEGSRAWATNIYIDAIRVLLVTALRAATLAALLVRIACEAL